MPVLMLLLICLGWTPVVPAHGWPAFRAHVARAADAGSASVARVPYAGLIRSVFAAREPYAGRLTGSVPVARAVMPARARRVSVRLAYAWPIVPAHVVRVFSPPPQPWLPGHRGVDLAAAPGVVVHAAGAGRVVYAGVLAGRGVVSVQHAGGLRTTYEPVTPAVAAGDTVEIGTPLGALQAGHPGCTVAACLHWGLRRGAIYLDPLALLGLGRVRLLPLSGPAPSALLVSALDRSALDRSAPAPSALNRSSPG